MIRITKTITVAALIATTLIVAIVASASGMTNSVFAQGAKKFTANLSGNEEVPSVDTKASGTAEFNVSSDGKTVSYKVDVKDINKVTMAHIHQGKKGENGPVVVTLFKSATPSGPMNGELAKGDATANKLEGPLKGKQISDLVKIMEDGNAYTNVHTEQNPKGEIRGQISK